MRASAIEIKVDTKAALRKVKHLKEQVEEIDADGHFDRIVQEMRLCTLTILFLGAVYLLLEVLR